MNESTRKKIARIKAGAMERAALVEKRVSGEGVTNLERWMVKIQEMGEVEAIPDEERGVCYRDLMDARTVYGGYASDHSVPGKKALIRTLTDPQLYVLWREWVARERRTVDTSTFAGWLVSKEP